MLLTPLLLLAGLFTVALGIAHFFLPVLLDFAGAIPPNGPPLRPFRLGPMRYATTRADVGGIAWVMNHAASYTLVTVGLVDLVAPLWLGTTAGAWLALWVGGWWLVRATSQLYLGRRPGDWLVTAGFGALAALHFAAALA